ncbi:MAG: Crp/Fnr family transcriptional regulator [Magnetovibrionaceae bacterium]
MPTLAGIPLFQDLAKPQREAIEKTCAWKTYEAQEQILDQQADGSDVCFVVTGRVRIVNYSLSGREVTLDDVEAGGYFGELAALDGEPRSASAMALVPTLIASLPAPVFVETLADHPDVALALMRRMAHIVRASTERIMDLSTLGANNRVHAELLRQARKAVESDRIADGKPELRPIPIHGEIASRVSTTRETVARVMNDLARQGIVQRTREALVIQDLNALEELVEHVRGD